MTGAPLVIREGATDEGVMWMVDPFETLDWRLVRAVRDAVENLGLQVLFVPTGRDAMEPS